MKIIHLITNSFPPKEGGLEKRLLRLTNSFAERGYHVIVYICSMEMDAKLFEEYKSDKVEIKVVGSYTKLLYEPIRFSGWSDIRNTMEKFRFDFIVLKNLVSEQLNAYKTDDHLILSSYITNSGFTACNIAMEFNIPHIASVVGTDFSRGFRNPIERQSIDFVINNATCVVSVNNEFRNIIKGLNRNVNIFTIHTSISDVVKSKRWYKQTSSKTINLFSDIGFCHKKGTNILVESLRYLLDCDFDVKLVLCGKTNAKEIDYWNAKKKEYKTLFAERIHILDYITEENLHSLILESDLYCYPTISEGCSNSRCAALCLGIPMVTTNCGEILDLIDDFSHIFYCNPGDLVAFQQLLKEVCLKFLNGEIEINTLKLDKVKKHLSIDREINEWLNVLDFALAAK
jgi:glycosyltransferase involved in cell wall biosynthesis